MTSYEIISQEITPPQESHRRIFLRFLRFGLLAWGGPVAQIAMIRQELVEEERWITRERFNRVLAVYQVLPGPEAHELCVYFGMLAGGRTGGILAGLGFMLPGFLLMFALSYLYVAYGSYLSLLAGLLWGFQTAVAALIIRAVHTIGRHAITNRLLLGIAILTGIAQLLGVSFMITLVLAGISYALLKRQFSAKQMQAILFIPLTLLPLAAAAPTIPALFVYGLRSGLLTFGGAYTVIPFLQHDAVVAGGWMTNEQFLDGLALSSILPAPLIIFSTFVGYLGGGAAGALALTAGIFLPAFLFTLIGHHYLERLVHNKTIHAFLDGVTAGVVGLIAAVTIEILQTAIDGVPAVVMFLTVLLLLFYWKSKFTVAVMVLAAGLVGYLIY
jgi:chromate transporter